MSFLALFSKSVQPLRYKLLARLTAYNGSIHALAMSNDGHLLACGGTEGIKLWDIKSRKELTSLSNHHESRGTVSCTIWAMTMKTTAETLCYGTGLGYIICLRCSLTDEKFQEICTRRLGSGFEITCLSWRLTSSEGNLSQLQSVFTVRLENMVPTSVAFADNWSIYVFGLYDGNFIKLKDEDGDIVQEISCKSVIGHAAVYSKQGVFIVDNATDGFTLYRLEGDGEPVRTFATGLPSMSVPKQVAFGEEGKGRTLETLHHTDTGLVQNNIQPLVDNDLLQPSAGHDCMYGRARCSLLSSPPPTSQLQVNIHRFLAILIMGLTSLPCSFIGRLSQKQHGQKLQIYEDPSSHIDHGLNILTLLFYGTAYRRYNLGRNSSTTTFNDLFQGMTLVGDQLRFSSDFMGKTRFSK
ncbi:hypothetical protein F4604DRAFT_1940197 [Suillus subluteus]|nr:hypothetical protein F4604DRAFT_1940197 [Suillus subluteus]